MKDRPMTIINGVVLVGTQDNVRILIDGDCLFEGSKEELRSVLERHRKFMEYVDSHDGDGEADTTSALTAGRG